MSYLEPLGFPTRLALRGYFAAQEAEDARRLAEEEVERQPTKT